MVSKVAARKYLQVKQRFIIQEKDVTKFQVELSPIVQRLFSPTANYNRARGSEAVTL